MREEVAGKTANVIAQSCRRDGAHAVKTLRPGATSTTHKTNVANMHSYTGTPLPLQPGSYHEIVPATNHATAFPAREARNDLVSGAHPLPHTTHRMGMNDSDDMGPISPTGGVPAAFMLLM